MAKLEKILVTGATGFLGRHLLEYIQQERADLEPLCLVRSPKEWKQYDWTKALDRVELVEGSILQPKHWETNAKLKGIRGIYHLAALIRHSRKDPEDIYETNIEGLLGMIRLAAKWRCRVVFVSTSGTVGCFSKPSQWADEESPYCEATVKRWPYYNSKIQAEKAARALADQLGVELVIIRPPVLLGPGDHRHRATGHIERMLRGKLPFMLKGGMHFIDIRDAVPAIVKAMEIKYPKPVYHLTGTECSIPEFFSMTAKIAGVSAPKITLPHYLAKTLAMATGQIEALLPKKRSHTLLPDPVVFEMAAKYWGLRSRYAAQDLDYQSRKPEDTLKDTVRWIRKQLGTSH